MIRTSRLALTTEDFASERRTILEKSDARLRMRGRADPVRPARLENAVVVAAALDVFDETASAESDTWTHIHDDLRDEFQRQLTESVKKTKLSKDRPAQIERITRWLSTTSVNGGTEAAAVADTSEGVGLEWVTMEDREVREIHRDVAGQTVPTGHAFEVGGEKLYLPGPAGRRPGGVDQLPVRGAPHHADRAAAKTITAAGTDLAEDQIVKHDGDISTTCVIVALPAEADPISAASSEARPT